MAGTSIKLKKNVLPSVFRTPTKTNKTASQVHSSAKKRKADFFKQLQTAKRKLTWEEQTPKTSYASTGDSATTAKSPSGKFKISLTKEEVTAGPSNEPTAAETMSDVPEITLPQSKEISQWAVCQVGESSSGTSDVSSYYSPSESTSSGSVTLKMNLQLRKTVSEHQILFLEARSRFYLGLPHDVYFVVKKIQLHCDLTHTDVLITLKKIRLNDAYVRLSDDFCVSATKVGTTINNAVPKMAALFKKLIYWPGSLTIKRMMPVPFRFRYQNVETIIDCFEIEIETPVDPLKQALTWSQYKKCNTIKYLISCTPHGQTNFVSQGFGGRATDQVILQNSEYLNVLPDNVEVMADRGLKQIESLLHVKNCKLVRPPSVLIGQKSSREQVKQSKVIAALRINVERVIRRVREFSLLDAHACVHHSLLHLLDYIVLIVCGIINLQGPLSK